MSGDTKQQRRRKQNKSITVTSVGSKDTTQKQERSKINDIQISVASFFEVYTLGSVSIKVFASVMLRRAKKAVSIAKEGNKDIGKGEGEAGRVKELLSLNHANKAF